MKPDETSGTSAGEPTAPTSRAPYRTDCPFCGSTHVSPYADVLETVVLACRDRAPGDKLGLLTDWDSRETLPVRPETEAGIYTTYDG